MKKFFMLNHIDRCKICALGLNGDGNNSEINFEE